MHLTRLGKNPFKYVKNYQEINLNTFVYAVAY